MAEKKAELKKIRTLRHWKQQYDPNARFVWRKAGVFEGKPFKAGELMTKKQQATCGKAKLRRMWESSAIELAEFEPKDQVEPRTLAEIELDKLAASAEAVALAEAEAEAAALLKALAPQGDGPPPTGEE